MRKEPIPVREFESIAARPDNGASAPEGFHFVDGAAFGDLAEFIRQYSATSGDADVLECLRMGYRRGIGETITVKNYVGLIETRSGCRIQILPKIDFSHGDEDNENTKKVFLRMLRSLKEFSSKALGNARLDARRMDLFEVFISMYVREAESLVKRGLRSDYVTIEEDLGALKGKLLLREQLTRNATHKERFAVAHDEYMLDRPENKLIKSTLLKLREATGDQNNKRDIIRLLSHFEMVSPSTNVDADLSRCVSDRAMANYETLLGWSRVFLKNRGFTTFSGESCAKSLLFPMDRLFEAYVAKCMRKAYSPLGWDVSAQHRGYWLFDDPRMFALRPDVVITKDDGTQVILDTKWKSLCPNPRVNYGISQGDMYQMYAYAKKYEATDVIVLYPLKAEMRGQPPIGFESEDGVRVRIRFIDLEDMDASLEAIKGEIGE